MTKTEFSKILELVSIKSKEDYIRENTPLHSFEKLDGSLILIGEIDGILVAKSKTSINSEHAKMANALIASNVKLHDYLYSTIVDGYTPVMELVGPGEFKIVLRYPEHALIWLGSVRHTNYEVKVVTEDEDVEYFKEVSGIRCAGVNKFSWDELNHIQENGKPDIEGFVVQTESGFTKCKLVSYVNLHHLKDSVNSINNLIALIISDDLDDLMGQFQDDVETCQYITEVQEKVAHKFNHLVVEFKELRRQYFQDFKENRKDFAIKYSKHALFSYVMKTLNESFRDVEQVAEGQVKMYIAKSTGSLLKATTWYESIKD